MGSDKWGYGVPLKAPLKSKGFYRACRVQGLGVVISGVISRGTIVITHIRVLISPLIVTHEPASLGLKN